MADAFVLGIVCSACSFGYQKILLSDEGSQLVKGCKDIIISYSVLQQKFHVEYGVEFKSCPIGAHYVHGKVERKIQEIKKSLMKNIRNNRLSVLQWESLSQQIANSINKYARGTVRKGGSARGGAVCEGGQCARGDSARGGTVREGGQCARGDSARGGTVREGGQCARGDSARGGTVREGDSV